MKSLCFLVSFLTFALHGNTQASLKKNCVTIENIVTNHITCNELGSFIISASGGTGALAYSIDGGSTYQLDNYFPNLSAGNYNIIARDASLCTDTEASIITGVLAPTIDNLSSNNITCNNLGDLTIIASGGNGSLEYSIDNGTNFQAGNTFINLTAQTYNVVVRDASACTDHSTITISGALAPTIDNIVKHDVTCAALGDITITASGGNGTLEYSIDDGTTFQTSNSFPNLTAQTYNIVVRDASLCTDEDVAIITGELAPTIDEVVKNDVTCNSLGDITIIASGGNGVLEYSIDGGTNYQVSNIFSGLTPNTYHIAVRDAAHCPSNTTININAVLVPSIDEVSTSNVSCTELGTISVAASEGYGTLVYSIDGGLTFQASNHFSGLNAEIYNIVVKDDNTCTDNETATITGAMAPNIDNIAKTNETCTELGAITINASGGNGVLSYSIDGGTTYKNYNYFGGLTAANLNISVKDEATCLVNNTVAIENEKIAIDTTVQRLSNTLTATFNDGTYRWLDCNNNYQPIQGMNNQAFLVKASGKYAAEITKNDCIDTSACHQVIISVLDKTEVPTSFNLLLNPYKQGVFVQLPFRLDEIRVQIYDVLGNLHFDKTQKHTDKIYANFMEKSGMYFVRVLGDKQLIGTKSMMIK